MITVVIPYFQREPGILRRALRSIASQVDCPLPVHVVVVDDSSPISAKAEVEAADPMPCPVSIIMQANGGPGAARNTGIAGAPMGTRYIAFLDSDDEWSPHHLSRAVAVLQAGFDFYFADLLQLGAAVTAFVRAGRIDPAAHPLISGPHSNIHAYEGDMLDQIIRGNVIGTSTVVYDAERFAGLRFKVEFFSAGEDYLFWLDIASAGARIAFSSECEATYGRGVNVYSGAGWGTDEHLRRIHDEVRFKKVMLRRYSLSAAQVTHIDGSITSLRGAFARDLVHRLSHRKKLPISLLAAHFRLDPAALIQVPLVAAASVLKRLGG